MGVTERNNMKTKINAFWDWFIANKAAYEHFGEQYAGDFDQVNRLLDELITELQKVSPGLFVEIGGKDGEWELIITPQGIRQYFAMAYEVVGLAPKIENWHFFATKPILGAEFSFKMGDVVINPETISFIPLESEEEPDEIAIRLFHQDYDEQDEPKRKAVVMGVYQALDSILGEVGATFDLDYVEFASKPDGDMKPLPIAEIIGYIKWKKKERETAGVRFPTEAVALLRGEREEKPIMVLVNRALKYYEYKNDFPYVLLVTITFNEVTEQGFPKEEMDEIYAIEDKISEVVCAGEKGHFISTETFDGSRKMYYAGQSKEILEAQVDLLKNELGASYSMDYSVSYDPFWVEASGFM